MEEPEVTAIRNLSAEGILCGLLFLMGLLACSLPCLAEELEPRRWSHLPVDTNFLGGGYGQTDGEISFDPVLRIEDARMTLHSWAAKYIRSFAMLGKSARIDILQGYAEGTWTGLLDGERSEVRRSGWTDTLARFAVNLYGAPPLKGKDYAQYRASVVNETLVGAAFSVQLPTGDYMDDKLINLGSNRFTFRPQVGAVHTRGRWSWETTGTVAIYTDNNEFFKGNKLKQDPLYTLNGHLICNLRRGVWVSTSIGYDSGGRSTVNGVKKDDRKQNLAWAITAGLPLHRRLGIKLSYIGIRTQEATGSDSDTFAMAFSTFW